MKLLLLNLCKCFNSCVTGTSHFSCFINICFTAYVMNSLWKWIPLGSEHNNLLSAHLPHFVLPKKKYFKRLSIVFNIILVRNSKQSQQKKCNSLKTLWFPTDWEGSDFILPVISAGPLLRSVSCPWKWKHAVDEHSWVNFDLLCVKFSHWPLCKKSLKKPRNFYAGFFALAKWI